MQETHKKALQHIADTLASVDTFNARKAILDILIEAGVEEKVRDRVDRIFMDKMLVETKKVNAAKSWSEAILKDIK